MVFYYSLDKVGNGVSGLVQHRLNVTKLKEYHGFDGNQSIVLGTGLKQRSLTLQQFYLLNSSGESLVVVLNIKGCLWHCATPLFFNDLH